MTASEHHSIRASEHHSITASQHQSITASQHHSITASQHYSITASQLIFRSNRITRFSSASRSQRSSVNLKAV
jgi:uncharacterized protein (DUF2345 family)